MEVLLIAASVFVFGSVALLVIQLWPERAVRDDMEQRMPQLYRVVRPVVKYLADINSRLPLSTVRDYYRKRIERAGLSFDMTPDDFLAIKELVLAGMVAFALLVYFADVARDPITIVGALVLGFFWPDTRLADTIRKRELAVVKMLPNFIDLLTLSVESGLDFVGAVRKVCDRFDPGPLVWEFRSFLQAIQLGKARNDALREMSTRLDVSDFAAFANAVIQATEAGASMGLVLRSQSEDMRLRRFQRAEKLAYEAPVKMLLPLVLFIFPATFLMILGPIALRLWQSGILQSI